MITKTATLALFFAMATTSSAADLQRNVNQATNGGDRMMSDMDRRGRDHELFMQANCRDEYVGHRAEASREKYQLRLQKDEFDRQERAAGKAEVVARLQAQRMRSEQAPVETPITEPIARVHQAPVCEDLRVKLALQQAKIAAADAPVAIELHDDSESETLIDDEADLRPLVERKVIAQEQLAVLANKTGIWALPSLKGPSNMMARNAIKLRLQEAERNDSDLEFFRTEFFLQGSERRSLDQIFAEALIL